MSKIKFKKGEYCCAGCDNKRKEKDGYENMRWSKYDSSEMRICINCAYVAENLDIIYLRDYCDLIELIKIAL